jgi:hypothetical protein
MDTNKPRYPKEEFARRGNAIYENDVKPRLKAGDKGKFVAIDIETGMYDISRSEMAAGNRLHKRVAGAQIWMVRVGYRAVREFKSPRLLLKKGSDPCLAP